MQLQLKIIGLLLILLSVIHVFFPKYFDWGKELSGLSMINRQMMYIHTFFIALVVMLMGLLCLISPDELAGTAFGKKVSFGFGIFWGARLYIQFFGYSKKLWKGKKFETAVHIIFSFLWMYLSFIFMKIWIG
jgi:hypothetical protein